MDIQNRKRKVWLQFATVVLFCGILLILGLGTAYARYKINVSETFSLTYAAQTDQIYVRSVEGSVSGNNVAEGIRVMNFVLSNGTANDAYCTYDQVANLSLFATVGMGDPGEFVITLNDGGSIYVASCSEVVEGTALYSLYGPGWIYRFYNEAGEELFWSFPGVRFIERQMSITVTGKCEFPTVFNVIADARPGDI